MKTLGIFCFKEELDWPVRKNTAKKQKMRYNTETCMRMHGEHENNTKITLLGKVHRRIDLQLQLRAEVQLCPQGREGMTLSAAWLLTCFSCSSLSSSSRKKVRYMMDTSTSQLPPYFLCSSMVSLPPEKACLLI